MYNMFKKVLTTIILCVSFFIVGLSFSGCESKFSLSNIKKINIGMNENQVVKILGEPYQKLGESEETDVLLVWYGEKTIKLTKKIEDLEIEIENALENEQFDRMEELIETQLRFDEELANLKDDKIEVVLTKGLVSSVYFEPSNYNEKATPKGKILEKNIMLCTVRAQCLYEEEKGGAYFKSLAGSNVTISENQETAKINMITRKFDLELEKTVPTIPLNVEIFEYDNFKFNDVDGELAVLQYLGNLKTLEIPSTAVYKNFTLEVTKISSRVSSRCEIKSNIIKIPSSIKKIETKTFDLRYIDEFIIDENNLYYKTIDGHIYSKDSKTLVAGALKSFNNKEFVIPEGVTKIGDYALAGSSISSLKMSDSVLEIGEEVFWCSYNLENIVWSNNLQSIGNSAFSACYGLTKIELPNSLISIGASAFNSCNKLSEIHFSNSLRSIGNSAFYGCESLTEIILPNSLTYIDNCAFMACYGLTKVIIPNNVQFIGLTVFSAYPYDTDKSMDACIIYCEETSIPIGWNDNWKDEEIEIIWGYTN